MANTLKIKRGAAASIPQGQLAEPLFTTDTYDLYIGKGGALGNQKFQKYITSGAATDFIKGDGTLDGTTYQATSEKGQNNGYASLDAGGKVPASQLPNSVMEYKGTWNANTNNPTLADGTGNAGDVYIVSVGGTQNLGSGSITFEVGDWVMYNGAIWQKSTSSNAVVSVNGQTGVVTITFDQLSPMTTLGDLIYGGASGGGTRLAGNITTTKKFLSQTGNATISAAPSWETVTKIDVGLGNVENTALSTWAGSTNITTLGTITAGTWNGTTIAIADGGTGATTKAAAFNALSPMTTLGDIIYGGASGAGTRLAGNTAASKRFLIQTGDGTNSAAPSWGSIAAGDVPTLNQNTTGSAATLTTARTFTIGATGKTFDGSANVSWTLAEIGAQAALTNPITGTGSETSGNIAYFTGAATIGGTTNFQFTNTSNLLVNNTVTSSGTIARGINFTPTLIAAANNDVLVGLDITPTFTNGAFTGVSNIALRVTGNATITGTITGTLSGNASTASTWATARTLTIGSTGKSVDGSGNVSWSLAEIGAAAALSGTSGRIAYWTSASAIGADNSLLFSPTSTLAVNNTITAAAGGASAFNLISTINAAADNDILYGVRISPTFNNGAFTGVTQRALGVFGNVYINGTITSGAWNGSVIGSSYGGAGTVNGIMKANGSGTVSAAVAGTDYQAVLTNPVTGTGTNNEIAYFNTTGSTIASLSTATYPSLTELSYVKGVTSAIQTQLNAKEPTVTKGNLTETTSSVLTITGGTGAVIGSGTTIQVKSASATQNGVVTTGTQTIAGAKTFTGQTTISDADLYVTNVTGSGGVNGNIIISDNRSIWWGSYGSGVYVAANSTGNIMTLKNTTAQNTGSLTVGSANTASYTLDVYGTGRFTGALSGTSATFSGNITSTGQLFIVSGSDTNIGYRLAGSAAGQTQWLLCGSGTGGVIATGGFAIRNETAGTNPLTISSTGAATFSSTITAADNLTLTGNYPSITLTATSGTNFYIESTYTLNRLSFGIVGSSTLMSILSSGNVGIGTTSPSTLLHLATTTETNIRLESGGAGGDQGSIYVQKSAGGGLTFAVENRDFIWRTGLAGLSGGGGTERMRITSGGCINIGQSSFNVGSISATNSIYIFDTKFQYINIGMNSNNAVINADWFSGASGATPNMIFQTGSTERMRITSGGNVGIGVTPSAWNLSGLQAMQIKNASFFGYSNNAYVGANIYYSAGGGSQWSYIASAAASLYEMGADHVFYTAPSGTAGTSITTLNERMRITSGGNVGIGTTSPVTYGTRNLDVNAGSGGAAYIVVRANSNAGTAELAFDTDAGYLSTKSNHPLIVRTNDTERMRITSGGNVELNGGSIKTGAPSGGTAKPWKLGARLSGTVSTSTTNYLEVEVDGTLYYLAFAVPL